MAQGSIGQVRPAGLKQDREAFNAVKSLSDYQPSNSAYEQAQLMAALAALTEAEECKQRAKAAYDAALDDYRAAAWTFHRAMLGAAQQVEAQYGPDSNEYQAMGRKKKSERKRPGPKRGSKRPRRSQQDQSG